jgi:peptidoglycan/LPS O-acetylase OafA/YrhL
LLLRLWLVERIRSAGIAGLTLLVAQIVAVLSVSDFSLARGDNFIMEGRTPVLTAYALAFAVFLVAVKSGRPHSLLLARIGLISYSMYLFHGSTNAAVYRFLPLTGQLSDIAVMLLCIVLTLAGSLLVYRLVERPMIVLGRALVVRPGISSRS